MKFSFKIQRYQTDAVEAVVRVFQGQPYNAGVSYVRDIGTLQDIDESYSEFTLQMKDAEEAFRNKLLAVS